MPTEHRMYIGGEWVGATGGGSFDDMSPFSGKVFGSIPAGSRQDARRAAEAAAAAFPAWAATPPSVRRMHFLRAADALERRSEEIARILIEETGATLGWSMFQLHFTPGLLREAAAQVTTVTGETIPADLPGAFFMTVRRPVGVVAGISPWNAPLILSLRAIALPIAYGNTAVLKPSEESPVAGGLVLAKIFEEAGFPKGVLNVVTHPVAAAEEIGDELISHPAVRRISFTGSTETGRRVAEKAGRHLKRATLELGGKDPLIVLRDADVGQAVDAAAFGSFLHQGQICMSVERIIVERPLAKEFTERLAAKTRGLKTGNPSEPDTVVGPLINRKALDKVRAHVDEAVGGGARVLCGGRFTGLCYEPTVLADVHPEMKVFSEETFGPVAPVVVVDDAEEAVRLANRSRYGLSGGIMTRDVQRALELAERIESGMIHINDSSVHDEPQVPFGGVKDSGVGRHGGRAALEEFTELRWITIQRTPRQYPF